MKAILGIGVPGSGKTTILKPLAASEGLAYINADDIREEVTGDPENHTKEPLVWRTVFARIRAGLQTEGVVVDVTNSRRKDRKRMVDFCREHGAREVVGYWIDVPLAVSLARNRQRGRVVPAEVIEKMQRSLLDSPPCKKEGFDEIFTIKAE